MFRNQTDKYSKFDEKGMPILDHKGEPIPKSALKKLAKEYEQQQKAHQQYLNSQSNKSDNNNNQQ
jgi:cysteinyl-tRNA synthetase